MAHHRCAQVTPKDPVKPGATSHLKREGTPFCFENLLPLPILGSIV